MFINKPTITDYMPKFVKEQIRENTAIFPYLDHVKVSKDNKTIKGSSTSPWKLCVRPFTPKAKLKMTSKNRTWGQMVKSWFLPGKERKSDYEIYFYDEVKGGIGESIGYRLPGHIIDNTLRLLEERDSKHQAQMMQQEQSETIKLESTDTRQRQREPSLLTDTLRKKSTMLLNPRRPSSRPSSRPESVHNSPVLNRKRTLSIKFDGHQQDEEPDVQIETLDQMKDMMQQMLQTLESMKEGAAHKKT